MSQPTETAAPEILLDQPYLRQEVPLGLIDLTADAPAPPPMDEVVSFAQSLQAEGLHFPALVNARPDGRFDLVYGHKRRLACMLLAKAGTRPATLPCRVVSGLTAEDVLMARISENLFRSNSDETARLAMIRDWDRLYRNRHPETEHGRAGGLASGAARTAAASEPKPADEDEGTKDNLSSVREDEPAGPSVEPARGEKAGARPFREVLAETTGKNVRTAQRDLKRARTFTDDELDVFKDRGVTADQQLKIAAIKVTNARAACVSQIAIGVPFDEAYAEATDGGRTPEGAPNAGKPEKEYTDEEWLAEFCPNRQRLKYPAMFDEDALAWRKLRAARAAWHKAVKGVFKGKKNLGPYARMARKSASVSHPNEWLLCGKCRGTGEDLGHPCPECRGPGYKITTEGDY
jgi:hypothetical protein